MTTATSTAVDPARAFEKAVEALNRSDAELPIDDVDRALKVAPSDSRLWHVKGLIHREQEQREIAIPALRRAFELAPGSALIAHGYSRTLLEAGLQSVEAFGRALKLNPKDPDIVIGLASALVAERRLDEAITGIETVVRRTPLWTDGHVLLAELRWLNGERRGFTRSFDQALREHPNSLDLRREQMTALLHAEYWDEVLQRTEAGRSLFGPHPLFVAFEAVAQSELGQIAAADALFAASEPFMDANLAVRRIRHLLRSRRAERALPLVDQWLGSADAKMFWPLAASVWRLTGDPRAEWLEGEERLVGVYDIGGLLPALNALAGALRALHTTNHQPLSQSVRGGTQTDGNLFHRIEPEVVALREVAREVVAEHVRSLPDLDAAHPLVRCRPPRIKFIGAWSVSLRAGGRHTNHIHPRGWLSSALYIEVPPDLGAVPHSGWLTLGEPDALLGLDLEPRHLIEPAPGRLALFPSWMWHGTRPFAEGERLTVAFDVAPAG